MVKTEHLIGSIQSVVDGLQVNVVQTPCSQVVETLVEFFDAHGQRVDRRDVASVIAFAQHVTRAGYPALGHYDRDDDDAIICPECRATLYATGDPPYCDNCGAEFDDIHPVRPRCRLVGEDGNVFSIIGRVASALRRAGMRDEADEFVERALASRSYDEALTLVFDYVEVE